MTGQAITIKGQDGDFSGYLAKPDSGAGPGVVVIQEIFGVNQVMRDVCDWLAGEGYVALCPDLFWRLEPGVELTDRTEAEWKRAFELMQAFDRDAGIRDIQSSIDALRAMEGVNGKVGAVGYCLGGHLAFLTACRTDCDAAAGYYGVNIPAVIEEAAQIKKPLILHVAGKDQFVDAAAQKAMHDALDGHQHVTLYDYPEDDHAFARPGGEHFNADSARTANARTLDLFRSNLG